MINSFRILLIFLDCLGIILFYFLFLYKSINYRSELYSFTSIALLLWIWFLISKNTKNYKENELQDSALQYTSLINSVILFIISSFLLVQLSMKVEVPFFEFYFEFYLYFICSLLIFMTTTRFFLFLLRRIQRKKTQTILNTIVIGEEKIYEKFAKNILPTNNLNINGCQYIDPTIFSTKNMAIELIELENFIKKNKILNIVLFYNSLPRSIFNKIVALENTLMVRIFVIPNFEGINPLLHQVDVFGGYPMIKKLREPLGNVENRLLKRIFDVSFSLFVILFLLPFISPIIILLIYLEDPGPIFYKQKRSGYLNKDFYCLKFRSMIINTHADVKAAEKGDKRVTKFGAFIRKTSLDELPQFFNVLKGEMSIVGPRPHMISQTIEYSTIGQKYMIRHFVKPGITGWAQINGSRGEMKTHKDIELRVEKDIWYIQHWSFMLDIKIIFLTVLNIFKGDKQAY